MPSNLGAAIYGLITVGALLAAESTQQETYSATLVAVVITLIVYGLAHSYADFTSWRLEKSKPIALDDLRRTLRSQLPILAGAGIPLIALLAAWALGASLDSAVTVAIWAAAAAIVAIEFIAGLRAGQTGRALVTQTAVGALLGGLMVVIRLVLH
ncbi:MAG TPA: hypothetical protein VMU39_16495 [Solirubrobacteraceae bacterium]|nr:hypothetical protein [Solirubrobacteraceae bacterium]